MKKLKIHIVADNTPKASLAKKKLVKFCPVYAAKKSDVIIVIGGDGFMLQSLKKYQFYNKPFYGLNSGNKGFLMNKITNKNLINNILKSTEVKLYPLEMSVKTSRKKIKKFVAINEVSVFRQSRQTTKLKISINNTVKLKALIADGILVATPAGSTAYNLSAKGPVLKLNSNNLAITPISPFVPRGWNGSKINNRSLIKIENLDLKKRPVSAVADNTEVRNASIIKIKIKKNIVFKVLYNKKFGLKEKNLAEHFKF